MKLFKNYLIAITLNLLAGLSSYGFRIILGNSLSTEDYGYFYFLFTFFSVTLLICDLGFRQTLPKLIPQYQVKQPESLKELIYTSYYNHLIVLTVIGIALFFFQDRFFQFANIISDEYKHVFLLYLSVFVLSSLLTYFTSLFLGFQRILVAQFWLFLRYAIPLLIYIILISFDSNNSLSLEDALHWFILAHLVCLLIASIFFLSLARFKLKGIPYRVSNTPKHLKLIYDVSRYTFFVTLFIAAIMHIDSIFLMKLSNLTEVGIFNYAIPFVMIIWLVVTQLFAVFLPTLSEYYNEHFEGQTFTYLKSVLLKTCVFVIPMIIGVLIFQKEILMLFFGSKALIASSSFTMLTIGVIFFTIGYYLVYTMIAINLQKYALIVVTMGLITSIGLNGLLDKSMGATGAAIANSSAMFVVCASGVYYFWKLKRWSFLNKEISLILLFLSLSVLISFFASFYYSMFVIKLISYVVLILLYIFYLRHFRIYKLQSEMRKLKSLFQWRKLKAN